MVKGQVPALHLDPETRQGPELDALASILPMDRRARLTPTTTTSNLKASRARRMGEKACGRSRRSRLFGGLGGRRQVPGRDRGAA